MTGKLKEGIPGYQKLIAWEKADLLAKAIYKTAPLFPKHELYGLTSQLRRATLSVVLNIIEGHARQNRNEFRQFLKIAYSSLAETEYLLDFAREQNYLTASKFEELESLRKDCGQVLWRLLKSQL